MFYLFLTINIPVLRQAHTCVHAAAQADVMIAGGAEAAITPLSYAGFCSLTAMATGYNDDPTRASRPFDKDRAGFVMAEVRMY